MISSLDSLAQVQETANLIADSLETRKRQLKVFQDCKLQQQKEYPVCLVHLGRINLENGKYDDAETCLKQAIESFEHKSGGTKIIIYYLVRARSRPSWLKHMRFSIVPREAEGWFRKTIAVAIKTHTNADHFYQSFACFYRSQDDLEKF